MTEIEQLIVRMALIFGEALLRTIAQANDEPIACEERLGGLLKFYRRAA